MSEITSTPPAASEAVQPGLAPLVVGIKTAAWLMNEDIETLRFWRKTGKGPSSFRPGKRIQYLVTDIVTFLDECKANDVYEVRRRELAARVPRPKRDRSGKRVPHPTVDPERATA